MKHIQFTLNDELIEVDQVAPTTTLLRYVRDHLRLTGTKEGCAEGDCGACTVVVINPETKKYQAINSCLLLLPMLQGKKVYTVEALKREEYHPVQKELVHRLGSQCGYCTAGVIMSLFEGCYRTDVTEPWQTQNNVA